jgi:two-component system, cell cycle sensor histidine kinase and response regulator CckA
MNVVTQFPAVRAYDRDLLFQAMFEGAAIGIGICRLDGRILEANPALSRMLGYSQQQLAGSYARELFPELHRDISPGSSSPDECRPDEPRPDECPPDQRWLGELMRGERDCFEIDKLCRRSDGAEFWGHLTVSLGRDARRHFLIAMLADATERKRLEERLRQTEKMEAIGRLAGGIAHDFNNLLTGILLYCDLLIAGLKSAVLENDGLENVALQNDGLENSRSGNGASGSGGMEAGRLCQHVEEVRRAGEQGAALARELLAIARKQPAKPQPIPINQIVASTENLLRRLTGEQIQLVTVLDSGAGLVLADPAQLRQILLNLVLNARDAMPQGGKIGLITRATEFPGEVGPGSARRAVSLTVKDNGCGMDAETRARLFEPFFTTKNPGQGTGLGLAMVQRIVSEAGGTIEVESEPGRGTSIAVFFPAIAPAAGAMEAMRSP